MDILKIRQNTTNYSRIVDVRDQNVNNARIIGCFNKFLI